MVALIVLLFIPAVPRSGYRSTLEYRDQDKGNQVAHVQCNCHISCCPERPIREDTKVETANRYFGQRENAEIEQFIPKIDLAQLDKSTLAIA